MRPVVSFDFGWFARFTRAAVFAVCMSWGLFGVAPVISQISGLDSGGGVSSSRIVTVISSLGGFGGYESIGDSTISMYQGYPGQINFGLFSKSQFVTYITPGLGAKIAITDILRSVISKDVSPFFLAQVPTQSSSGGSVIDDGYWLIYTPPSTSPNSDSFLVTVADKLGSQLSIPIYLVDSSVYSPPMDTPLLPTWAVVCLLVSFLGLGHFRRR